MTGTKALTVRLPEWLAEDLETVAQVDGMPMAEVVRAAVTSYIARRTEQPDWPARVQAAVGRFERLMEATG